MIRKISLLLCLFVHSTVTLYAQMADYNYKCELKGIESQWHKIILPAAVFGKVSGNMNDIRIYGITPTSDTVEAPYILKKNESSNVNLTRNFKLINKSFSALGSYFTFETPSETIVNEISLNFNQANFDWKIQLEGSHNQLSWFTIIDNYRILSIQNEEVTFSYSKIKFSPSKYRYYRILVKSTGNPELLSASLVETKTYKGLSNLLVPENLKISQVKELRETHIDFNLQQAVPVSDIKINADENFDYYRPVIIQYAYDSTMFQNGTKYYYTTLTSGTLNSLGENDFAISSAVMQRMRIVIKNYDNQPLTISSVEVKSPVYELYARFTQKAAYYLVYGNSKATFPQYDLEQFQEKIPENPPALEPGKEIAIVHQPDQPEAPLFVSKFWLWTIMLAIMLQLGWFSISMIKKK